MIASDFPFYKLQSLTRHLQFIEFSLNNLNCFCLSAKWSFTLPIRILSFANSRCLVVTEQSPSVAARIAAWLTRLAKSAPESSKYHLVTKTANHKVLYTTATTSTANHKVCTTLYDQSLPTQPISTLNAQLRKKKSPHIFAHLMKF